MYYPASDLIDAWFLWTWFSLILVGHYGTGRSQMLVIVETCILQSTIKTITMAESNYFVDNKEQKQGVLT